MGTAGFVHEALVHRDDDAYVAATVDFLREGVREGETAVALLGPRGRELLAGALDGSGVRVVDTTDLGRNPARLIPTLRDLLETARGPLRCVGNSTRATHDPAAAAETALHEALLNLAFDDAIDFRLRCTVDADALPEAEHTHPTVLDGGTSRPGAAYDPDHGYAVFARPLPEATTPLDLDDVHFTLDDLPELRDLVTVRSSAFGLSRDRALDLTLATNEIVTNSIVHGGDRGTLRTWHDERTFTCEVTDSGHITNPLVGRVSPIPAVQGGRGVWLANRLCDLVSIRSAPGTGTVVRLQVDR
ncbi:putative regulator of sigma factor [Actinokineospora spheciospongiae]|uniref:Putative regulator of sigma factor n=1 Tax=Actinokineospora spheciospongiae TaxID=909613 RepID=W7J8Z6_9PSEU|nr:sensor histidine kinase [Actinokineospora spheciospongiae]EWC62494.1 putative regulator of sigma factor [Actinokineospora spheciospongiae]